MQDRNASGVLKDRIIPVGNAAGEGAKLALLNKEELETGREACTSYGISGACGIT